MLSATLSFVSDSSHIVAFSLSLSVFSLKGGSTTPDRMEALDLVSQWRTRPVWQVGYFVHATNLYFYLCGFYLIYPI